MKILEEYEVDEEINRQSLEGPKKFAFYVFNPDGSGTLFCWQDEIDEALIWLTYLTSAMYFFYEEEMQGRKDFLAKALPRAINASKKIIIFEDFVDEIQKILSEFIDPHIGPFGKYAYLGRYEDLLKGNKDFERAVRARFRSCDMYDEYHEFKGIVPPRVRPKDNEITHEELEVFSEYVTTMS